LPAGTPQEGSNPSSVAQIGDGIERGDKANKRPNTREPEAKARENPTPMLPLERGPLKKLEAQIPPEERLVLFALGRTERTSMKVKRVAQTVIAIWQVCGLAEEQGRQKQRR
jgi:hypothetical protein